MNAIVPCEGTNAKFYQRLSPDEVEQVCVGFQPALHAERDHAALVTVLVVARIASDMAITFCAFPLTVVDAQF